MEADDLQHPSFRVLTYRDGQEVISETVASEAAARIRFTSAVDLCRTRDGAHSHRVELWQGSSLLDDWPQADGSALIGQ
ncbi:hypothetical protein [Methylobacterium oxalidis]|uniref:Uncharacterized protein n=1 Tax=Methylobacterium oxalidis TaxID=944322 RepID=A0A512JCD8_9HYPH|nr:hypothetical protein [Methylobacterium oxalidis]GEP07626.1 hypothetical protein MOX02_56640 [Methylobacterium oxalidis]GJE35648.1 hypothetical protein LDDCCGHA_5868 [Methylobacterium oxalidis]GLS65541.1 hypothetical protein GCM10007888_39230 [Methylobacterium oxalidis]